MREKARLEIRDVTGHQGLVRAPWGKHWVHRLVIRRSSAFNCRWGIKTMLWQHQLTLIKPTMGEKKETRRHTCIEISSNMRNWLATDAKYLGSCRNTTSRNPTAQLIPLPLDKLLSVRSAIPASSSGAQPISAPFQSGPNRGWRPTEVACGTSIGGWFQTFCLFSLVLPKGWLGD